MPRTKTPAATRSTKSARNGNAIPPESVEVFDLAEAAGYLRVAPDDVLRMVASHGLPGRQFGADWRFLKAALQQWLSVPPPVVTKQSFWDTHFGALKDDPYREEILAEIYRRRGRPEKS